MLVYQEKQKILELAGQGLFLDEVAGSIRLFTKTGQTERGDGGTLVFYRQLAVFKHKEEAELFIKLINLAAEAIVTNG